MAVAASSPRLHTLHARQLRWYTRVLVTTFSASYTWHILIIMATHSYIIMITLPPQAGHPAISSSALMESVAVLVL